MDDECFAVCEGLCASFNRACKLSFPCVGSGVHDECCAVCEGLCASFSSTCTLPLPCVDAGVAGEIGVIGPPGVGVGGYRLALDGGITGVGTLGVGPSPKDCRVPGDTTGL